MRTIEIARKLAALGQREDACRAYSLALYENDGGDPGIELEAAVYILQSGGDYHTSYTCFCSLYNRGYFREDILPLMTKVFYEPNIKLLKSRYERNCKLLKRYPYLFRKDFLSFEELPILFYPYDDSNGYVPFYTKEERFGNYINFKNPVISRNFFKDLEKPVLADDVYSQYELEYLKDNVRRSEDVARENHVYLYYTDWDVFCSYLQCLSMRTLLEGEKLVFLIESEISQYPIDFQARFGINYSQYKVRPVGIREINRMIWHTQLSTHNGGDFFNEIFDFHPNLLALPSIMMSNVEELIGDLRKVIGGATNLKHALQSLTSWNPWLVEELYHMKDPTDKDFLVAKYLSMSTATAGLDLASRIVPAVFFQPHFRNIVYQLRVDEKNQTILEAKNVEDIHSSPLFRNFKYIKTFTPMRRFTTSHGATVKFMYRMAQEEKKENEKQGVVSDAISERIFNRSFMIDPEDRLYKDSILVRFEDGKLNPKATFTALAAFLDLPYTESMTYCSINGEHNASSFEGNDVGFDPAAIYRTYDEYVNDSERYFIEYFLQDAYAYYGYDFHYYDGAEVDEQKVEELINNFTTINHYIRETWRKIFGQAKVSRNDGKEVSAETERAVQEQILENYIQAFNRNRLANAKILLEGLRFVNQNGQPLRMMRKLELDPALLEQPLYH